MSKGTGSATSQNAGMLVRDNCTGEVEKSESRACVSPATGWELGVTQTRVGASCGSGALNLDLVHCGVFDFMPFFVQEVGEVGGALLPVLRKDHSQLGVGLGKRLDASLFGRNAGGCQENVSIFRHHVHQGKVAEKYCHSRDSHRLSSGTGRHPAAYPAQHPTENGPCGGL